DESIILPHVDRGKLTGIYLQLLVKDQADVASKQAYLTVAVPGQSPLPLTIGAQNSAMVTREMASFGGTWNLTFTLEDTPPLLKDGDFLNPNTLLDIALIVYFKGDLHW